jgi:hypothetical protein
MLQGVIARIVDLSMFLLAVCNSVCQHGGDCTGPNTCECAQTGYSGANCEIPGGLLQFPKHLQDASSSHGHGHGTVCMTMHCDYPYTPFACIPSDISHLASYCFLTEQLMYANHYNNQECSGAGKCYEG